MARERILTLVGVKLRKKVERIFLIAVLNATVGCVALLPLIEPDHRAATQSNPELGGASSRHSPARRLRDPIVAVIKQLENGDAAARTRAATTLGEYPGRVDDSIGPLIRATEDPSKNVRRAAVKALARLKDSRGVAPIRQRLKDPDPFVRESARNALRQLNVRAG